MCISYARAHAHAYFCIRVYIWPNCEVIEHLQLCVHVHARVRVDHDQLLKPYSYSEYCYNAFDLINIHIYRYRTFFWSDHSRVN